MQSLEADLDFLSRVHRSHAGRAPKLYREDFCGTAALATAFVRRHPGHRAYGVDLHGPTLEWGLTRHVAPLEPEAQARITLLQENVLEAVTPPVDIVTALNFSYSVFKTRDELRRYFQAARRDLHPGGIFIVDAFGGTEGVVEFIERRRIPAGHTLEGERVPPFTYVWEQAAFDIITHDILCHIHFEFPNGSRIRRAFTYDWRLWSLPELREIMMEAGFVKTEVYLQGWIEKTGQGDGIFRPRRKSENAESWIAYVVGRR